MADSVAPIAYQLGIRLRQCLDISANSMTADWGSLSDDVSPQDIALSKYAVGRLQEAVHDYAAAANVPEAVVHVAHSLLAYLDSFWSAVERHGQASLSFEGMNVEPAYRFLKDLNEALWSMVNAYSPAAAHWFELGDQICDGFLFQEPDRPSPAWGDGSTKLTAEQDNRSIPRWHWSDEDRLQQLIEATRADMNDLCPPVEAISNVLQLLPYSLHELPVWFRVEAGLAGVLGRNSGPNPPSDQIICLTDRHRLILDALDGKALKTDDLAQKTEIERRSLFRRDDKLGLLAELQEWGLVAHKRGIGYYRPDRLPPNFRVMPSTEH